MIAKTVLNYEKVLSQLNAIEETIDEFNNQINILKSTQQELNSAWQGEASDTFKNVIDTKITDMERTKQNMVRLTQKIKHVADQIRKSDQKEAELVLDLFHI